MNEMDETAVPQNDTRSPDPDADRAPDTGGLPQEADHSRPDEAELETVEDGGEAAPEPTPEEAALAKAAELADKLKRREAEFVNETKRIRRKSDEERKFAIERVVVDLLPVLDALQAAGESIGEGEAADAMRHGLDLVEKQLETVLERYGVASIDALGQAFDPGRHQAMMMVEHPDFDPQTVCEVLRAGYELNGRVVRAAEVLVAKAPADEDAGDGDAPAADATADDTPDEPAGEA